MRLGRPGKGKFYECLQQRNLTLDELAERASNSQIRFSKSTLSRIANGRIYPSREHRRALCETLDIDMKEFENLFQLELFE
jgi:transcriptional regulator with XRE-family HTH domain